MKKRWLCGTMALVIGAMAMAGCSGGNSSSSASAAGTEAADSANAFKKLVEEGSNGRIKVEVYAGDMTTDEVECVEMVQNNNLEIGWVGTGALGGFVPDLGIFELPFLFEDEDNVNKALEGEFGNSLLEQLSAVDGITGLGFHEDGWRNILTKDKTINTVDDMKYENHAE